MLATLLEAAAQVLEAKGLEGFNTNAVAERAGVSIGSLYQYFPSKDALHDQMVAAGVAMKTDVFKHERGSRFFCEVPGGVLVEINTRSDANEQYRGTFDL